MSLLPQFTPPPDVGWIASYWADDPLTGGGFVGQSQDAIQNSEHDGHTLLRYSTWNSLIHTRNDPLLNNRGSWTVWPGNSGMLKFLPYAESAAIGNSFSVVWVGYLPPFSAWSGGSLGALTQGATVAPGTMGAYASLQDGNYGTVTNTYSSGSNANYLSRRTLVGTPHMNVLRLTGSGNARIMVNGENYGPGVYSDAGAWLGYIGLGGGSNATTAPHQIGFVGYYDGDVTTDPEWANFLAWVEDHYGFDPTATYDTNEPPPVAWRAEYLADDFDESNGSWPDRTGRGYLLRSSTRISGGKLRFPSTSTSGTLAGAESDQNLRIGGPTVTLFDNNDNASTPGTYMNSTNFTPQPNSLLVVACRCTHDHPEMTFSTSGLSNIGTWTYAYAYSSDATAGCIMLGWATVGESPGTGSVGANWTGAATERWLTVMGVTGHDPNDPVAYTASRGGLSSGGYFALNIGAPDDLLPLNSLVISATAQTHGGAPAPLTPDELYSSQGLNTNVWGGSTSRSAWNTASRSDTITYGGFAGGYCAVAACVINPHPDNGDGGFTATWKWAPKKTYAGSIQPVISQMTDGARRFYITKGQSTDQMSLVFFDPKGNSTTVNSSASIPHTADLAEMWYRVKYVAEPTPLVYWWWSHNGTDWILDSSAAPSNPRPVWGNLGEKDSFSYTPKLVVGRNDLSNPISLSNDASVSLVEITNSGGAYDSPDPGGDVVFSADFSQVADSAESFTEGSSFGATVMVKGTHPIKVDNELNGQPVVRFDGVDDFLVNGSIACGAPTTTVVVAKFRTNPGANKPILSSPGSRWIPGSDGTDWKVENWGVVNVPSTPTTRPTDWHLVRMYSTAAATSVFAVDDVVLGSSYWFGGAGFTSLYVGAESNGTQAAAIDVAYIGVFYGDVTQSALWPAFKAWITAKYGIPT